MFIVIEHFIDMANTPRFLHAVPRNNGFKNLKTGHVFLHKTFFLFSVSKNIRKFSHRTLKNMDIWLGDTLFE